MEEKRKPNLLIVDDDSLIRNALTRTLRKNFHITEAKNGREALPMILNESFDAVLTDVDMPVMNGVEMLLSVYASNPFKARKMVILTGCLSPPDLSDFPESIRILRKPFDSNQLISSLMEVASI